ncbi:three-helix bundle dimerization domain-containing protein [Rhodococcus opacus]|uniref:three-helix bundle dimerization domain-containing protein n=1 Tax=Rhodococcus opacus TaxID=37919 RepID=UPI001009CDE1|nr:hypothetical protein [Rhodococcus opacus]
MKLDNAAGRNSVSIQELIMATPASSDANIAALEAVPTPTVAQLPPVAVIELDSIAGVLSRRFPEFTHTHVRAVVYATYRRLASAARIHTHLIPLTMNCSRSELQMEVSDRARHPLAER